MGEIKSTLDIVMEKTRHLTLSEAEKTEQKQNEVRKRLKGLLQKYTDSLLRKEGLTRELEGLRKTCDLEIHDMLARMLLSGLEPDQGNEAELELLDEICGIDVSRLEVLLRECQDKVRLEAEQRTKKIKSRLAQKRFISGSAVVPNIETDSKWISTFQTIKGKYDRILKEETAKITTRLSP